jgi:ribosomal protein S20
MSLVGLAAAVAMLVAAPLALAITLDEYKVQVEPICKHNTETSTTILKGVKTQIQKGDLAPAGRRFIRASTALGKAVTQIAAVPKPEEEAIKLTKWIGYLKEQKTYLQKIGQALKAGNKFKAQQSAVKLNKANKRANDTVISFGFNHCRIDSSKFL